MNERLLCVLLFLFVSGIATADESPSTKPEVADPPIIQERYMLTLAEYRLKDTVPIDANESEVVAFILDQETEPLGAVRLSATNDTESMARFENAVTVLAGKI